MCYVGSVIKLLQKHIIFNLVSVECLCVHFIVGILIGQIEKDAEGQVQVVRFCQACLFSKSEMEEHKYI